jgi:GH25 family lysozyme M1 (1,4-beta-N-acetylmuramidase)
MTGGILAALVLASAWATARPAGASGPGGSAGEAVGAAPGAGFAGSFRDAGRSGPPVAAKQPPNSLPGIDVSHHQETIDWTQVAASGQRFALAKATEGTGYIDPMYATNRAGATAAGIAFGAYHFARPDLHPNNPIAEADHFVDTAQLGAGNLVPVLDLERSGDLSQAALSEWILAWLNQVTARTGVRPMVYTSPNGWDDRTGDTTTIADAGYTVLWVAHWGVETPTLPANDWQGHGWTFWQYSNCGSVPGIVGCVDIDWFNGLDFQPVTIPSPDTIAPVATLAVPTGVAGPITVSFSEIVRQVTPGNVVLRSLTSGADVPATLTCSSKTGKQVDCVTAKLVTVVLEPSGALMPGESYAAIVNPTGVLPPVVDRSGNPAAMIQQDFAPPTQVEQSSESVEYEWRGVGARKAYGASYAVEHLGGAAASYTFTGTRVTWFTVTGPAHGKAAVSIDGRARGTFNQYAPSTEFKVGRTFKGLAPGEHTITVRVLGEKGSTSGTDTQVAIDAFEAGGKVVWTPQLTVSWGKRKLLPASGRSLVATDLSRSEATFTFRGTGVEWHTVRGPDQGRAQVFVDGAEVKTVDNYASRTATVVRPFGGLVVGVHELRIVVVGTARPAATGARISIDAFSVLP